jgi:hypothetical protein
MNNLTGTEEPGLPKNSKVFRGHLAKASYYRIPGKHWRLLAKLRSCLMLGRTMGRSGYVDLILLLYSSR